MTFASRVTDLVDALATAFNARNQPGASDYQVWLAQGNTGTIDNYRASILGADMDFAAQFLSQLGAVPTVKTATEAQAGITQLATAAEAAAGNSLKAISAARALDFLNANQDAVAVLTGVRRGTAAQRTALAGAQLLDQLRFYETDSRTSWIYSTAGAYWFKENAQVTIAYNGANATVGAQAVTQVPFDTLDGSDDTNLYTTTLGANASIKINRGGLYRVTALVLVDSGQTLDYKSALLRVGTSIVRESNVAMKGGRIFVGFDWRLGDAGGTINAAAYSNIAAQIIAANGSQSNNLQVARIGD